MRSTRLPSAGALLAAVLATILLSASVCNASPVPNNDLAAISEHRFLFVIGAHHSGTSVMKSILQQHPLISGHGTASSAHESWIDEGQHLQTVYATAEASGGMQEYGSVALALCVALLLCRLASALLCLTETPSIT